MGAKTQASKDSKKKSTSKPSAKAAPAPKAVSAKVARVVPGKAVMKDVGRSAKSPAKVAPAKVVIKKSEPVQLSARKPEKKSDKATAKKAAPAAKAQPASKKAAPASASASTKIVSTLKSLLGGSAPAPKKGQKPEAKKEAPKKAEPAKPAKAAPEKSVQAPAAAQGNRPGKPGAPAGAVAAKAAISGGSESSSAPAVAKPAVAKPAPTAKTVKKAVSKAGSGLTAHGLGDSCREVACENMATTGTYCRMHYIKNWRRIKNKEKILAENRINGFIEELVAKYPEKYIEAIRADLASEKEFAKVISDLDLDESVDDFEGEGGENVEAIIDTIRRDFDEDGEGF